MHTYPTIASTVPAIMVALVVLGMAGSRASTNEPAPVPPTLAQAIAEALKANPALKAAGDQANASEHEARVVEPVRDFYVRLTTFALKHHRHGGGHDSDCVAMGHRPRTPFAAGGGRHRRPAGLNVFDDGLCADFYSLFEDAGLAGKRWFPRKAPALPAVPETPSAG